MSVNARLKAIQILGKRTAICRQRAESSCFSLAVDLDILITSRYGDRKIMQSMRIMSRTPSRIR